MRPHVTYWLWSLDKDLPFAEGRGWRSSHRRYSDVRTAARAFRRLGDGAVLEMCPHDRRWKRRPKRIWSAHLAELGWPPQEQP